MLVFIDKGSSNTTPWLVIASDERYYVAHTGTAFMKVVHKVQIPNLQKQVSTNLLNQALKRAKPALGLLFGTSMFGCAKWIQWMNHWGFKALSKGQELGIPKPIVHQSLNDWLLFDFVHK